jgi:hypothetical protein
MGELGHVRAEKQALEQQISDLFALKAKHAPGSSRKNVSHFTHILFEDAEGQTRKGPVPPQVTQQPGPGQMMSPGMQARMLPAPPR